MTVDSLARAEVRRFADEDTSERVRNEMMGVLGELLGISPEQMEELRSEDGQRRLHEGMKKFEGEVQEDVYKRQPPARHEARDVFRGRLQARYRLCLLQPARAVVRDLLGARPRSGHHS